MVVGISGASGFIYGVRLLQLLAELNIESHLIISRAALLTMAHETDYKLADVTALASHYHRADDVAAGIASGSFRCWAWWSRRVRCARWRRSPPARLPG